MTIIRSCVIMSTMKLDEEKMIKTIIVHGWYGEFKKFCTTLPLSVRSRKRKAYLFLIHKNQRTLINLMCKKNSLLNICNIYEIAKVRWLHE